MYEKSDIDTMVLVCSGDQSLHFVYEDLRLKENIPISAAFDSIIRVRDPLSFTSNVLAGAAEFRVAGFLTRYEGELQNALQKLSAYTPGSY